MYGKSNMETYNAICKRDSQWEFAVWLKKLKQGLCDNLERWDGEGDGREFGEGGNMGVLMTDSCWCLQKTRKSCKAIIFSIKKIFLRQKKENLVFSSKEKNIRNKEMIHIHFKK